jgi:hypothetical protein
MSNTITTEERKVHEGNYFVFLRVLVVCDFSNEL